MNPLDLSITEDEKSAVIACAMGVANSRQAKVAFEWLLREPCLGLANSYVSGNGEASGMAFIAGRQWVGSLVRGVISGQITPPKPKDGSKSPIMSDRLAEQIATGAGAPTEEAKPNVRRKRGSGSSRSS